MLKAFAREYGFKYVFTLDWYNIANEINLVWLN